MSKININIDIGSVIQEFLLTPNQVDSINEKIVSDLTELIFVNWKAQAKQALNSTRQRYVENLIVVDRGRFANSIVLLGELPNMIENGVSAFDMKLGFQQSEKVKYSKDGNWFLTIPFRFATPGALGENEAFNGGVLPKEVYNVAKNLPEKRTSFKSGVIKRGKPLTEVPSPFDIPKTTAGTSISAPYTHKSSIYKGIYRNKKMYENADQSSYNSFRRVGAKSDPNSWIHSGIKAHNLAEKAVESSDIDTQVNNTIDSFLS